MRVLHVISSLNSRAGGTFTAVRDIAIAQANSGLDVSVCTTYRTLEELLDLEKLRILFLNSGITLYTFKAVSPLLFSLKLYKWLSGRRDFDCLHIHGLYRLPTAIAAHFAFKNKIPYLMTPHGSLVPFLYKQSRYGSWGLRLKRLYERVLENHNLDRASVIHFTSHEEALDAGALNIKAPFVVLPIGIDWHSYESLPQFGGFRQRAKLDSDTPLILFLGRVDFKKGIDLLIHSFAQVLREIPKARLAIVGPDSSGYLQKVHLWCNELNIDNEVIFINHLEPAQVKEAYVDANVFILPSYNENFGITVIEAMACKCPVIISDQVNIWREIQNGSAGIVIQLSVDDLTKAVIKMLNHPEEAQIMGISGRILAKDQYDWNSIVARYTELYVSMVDGSFNKKMAG
jgi:glycosyltransferase involved in cell wall biosynthesis